MARKRKMKRTKRSGRSLRSSGGMLGKIDFTSTLATAVGGIAAKFVDKIVPTTVDPKVLAGGKIALGLFLPNLVKDAKSKAMLQGVGAGMIAIGSVDLLKGFGVLSGINDDELLAVSLEGIDDLPVVNGTDDLPVVNGDVDVLAGDVDVLAGDDAEFEYL